MKFILQLIFCNLNIFCWALCKEYSNFLPYFAFGIAFDSPSEEWKTNKWITIDQICYATNALPQGTMWNQKMNIFPAWDIPQFEIKTLLPILMQDFSVPKALTFLHSQSDTFHVSSQIPKYMTFVFNFQQISILFVNWFSVSCHKKKWWKVFWKFFMHWWATMLISMWTKRNSTIRVLLHFCWLWKSYVLEKNCVRFTASCPTISACLIIWLAHALNILRRFLISLHWQCITWFRRKRLKTHLTCDLVAIEKA